MMKKLSILLSLILTMSMENFAQSCLVITPSGQFTIMQPSALVATCSAINVTVSGGNNGQASVSAIGGTVPYSYLWSNGRTTTSITGLSAGVYAVTVTDARLCSAICSSTVNEGVCMLNVTATNSNISCNGFTTGGATATATGNLGSISYLWSNGSTTAAITGLGVGTYRVTATESPSCKASTSITVTDGFERRLIVSHTGASGGGSLRQAILCANARIPFDTIFFNVPTSDPNYRNPDGIVNNGDEFWNLSLAVNDLPIVTDTLVIDGLTQLNAQCSDKSLLTTYSNYVNANATGIQAKGQKPRGMKFLVNGGGLSKQGIEIQSSATLLIIKGIVFVNWVNSDTTGIGTVKLKPLSPSSRITLDCAFMTSKL